MTFELTDSIKNDIIFAMEDQNSQSVFDAEKKRVVRIGEDFCFSEEALPVDEEKIYSLPRWTSDDGFDLMEEFAENCRSPLARNELKRCLQSRRGVFRNFKNILKMYPDVEKRWFLFKTKRMTARINEWYSELCEIWGLDFLEEDSQDETEELVQNDFEFKEYDSVRDKECIDRTVEIMAEEYKNSFEGEIGISIAAMWRYQSAFSKSENKYGFVCYSHTQEFLGCALFSLCPSPAKKTAVFTDFFVFQNYRGLGIGKELLRRCLENSKKRGIQWILFSNTIIPESMESLLTQFSFEKIGSGYIVDILKDFN
ncbi:GNAT family N-acetyltransferase [Treponema sp.]|uniref:GNAT family N-acetyltransferase n=1 Tax=Treponema sp. TaxID=166 RepID=UPI003F05FB84